jgi:hypothetical protein
MIRAILQVLVSKVLNSNLTRTYPNGLFAFLADENVLPQWRKSHPVTLRRRFMGMLVGKQSFAHQGVKT